MDTVSEVMKISLAIHHGGYFNVIPLFYNGGKVVYLTDYDQNKLTLNELKSIVDMHAENPTYRLFYKPAEESFEDTMMVLTCEEDMMGLFTCRRDLGPIGVYALDERGFNMSNKTDDLHDGPVYEAVCDEDDDNQSVASLDHISDCEEEALEVRKTVLEKKENLKRKGTCGAEVDTDGNGFTNEAPTSDDEDDHTYEGDADLDGPDPNSVDLNGPDPNAVDLNGPDPISGNADGPGPNSADIDGPGPNSGNADGPATNIESVGPSKKVKKQSVEHPRERTNPNADTHSSIPYQHGPKLTELCEEFDASNYVEPEIDSDDDRRIPTRDSEDEEEIDKNEKWLIHNPQVHWKKMRPYKGERYQSIDQLKHCLQCYSVANGRMIRNKKSDKSRLIVRCQKLCPWKLHASWMQDKSAFQVKSLLDKHNCVQTWSSSMINHEWIAHMFANKIRQNPTWNLLDFKDEVLRKYSIRVTPHMCYRARRKVLDELEGTLKEHYALLWRYAQELCRSNPGSTVKMMVNRPTEQSQGVFQRFYVCLHAVKQGWKKGCRKFIGFDGCFLKNLCSGQLLSAVGKDANNHIYPIAWAVVESETRDSWYWFIKLLCEDIDAEVGFGWTVMSDGQKGLLSAVDDLLPYAEHRRCARHIYAGLRKKNNSVLIRNLFWRAAKSTTPVQFDAVMTELKTEDKECYAYLTHKDREPKTWSRAFFSFDSSVGNVENNACECFNAYILAARRKPIITMLEEIRVMTMLRIAKMRDMSKRIDDPDGLLKVPRKMLEKNKADGRFWRAEHNGDNEFEMKKQGLDTVTVDLRRRSCACREWMLNGIPCEHACGAIMGIGDSPEKYMRHWFFKDCFDKTYEEVLRPVNGVQLWPQSNIEPVLPPKARRARGRPKYLRRREEGEDGKGKGKEQATSTRYVNAIPKLGRQIRCQNCLEFGHNKRACKNDHVEAPPKVIGKPGRPRKGSTSNTQEPDIPNPRPRPRPTTATKKRKSAENVTQNEGTSTAENVTQNGAQNDTQIETEIFVRDGTTDGENLVRRKLPVGYGVIYDEITGQYYVGSEYADPIPSSQLIRARKPSSHEQPSSQIGGRAQESHVTASFGESAPSRTQSQPPPEVPQSQSYQMPPIIKSQPPPVLSESGSSQSQTLKAVFCKSNAAASGVTSPSRRSERILRTRLGRSISPNEPGGSPSTAIRVTMDDPDVEEYEEELRKKATVGKGKGKKK